MVQLNLANLREITGGNQELEKILFSEFIKACDIAIAGLEAAVKGNGNEDWYRHSHALKGASLNLGAEQLSQLSKEAQDQSTTPPEIKLTMLKKIKEEYNSVKGFLEKS